MKAHQMKLKRRPSARLPNARPVRRRPGKGNKRKRNGKGENRKQKTGMKRMNGKRRGKGTENTNGENYLLQKEQINSVFASHASFLSLFLADDTPRPSPLGIATGDNDEPTMLPSVNLADILREPKETPTDSPSMERFSSETPTISSTSSPSLRPTIPTYPSTHPSDYSSFPSTDPTGGSQPPSLLPTLSTESPTDETMVPTLPPSEQSSNPTVSPTQPTTPLAVVFSDFQLVFDSGPETMLSTNQTATMSSLVFGHLSTFLRDQLSLNFEFNYDTIDGEISGLVARGVIVSGKVTFDETSTRLPTQDGLDILVFSAFSFPFVQDFLDSVKSELRVFDSVRQVTISSVD